MQVPARGRFQGEDGLIGLDFEHFLALTDFGPIREEPFDQGNFLDGLA